MYKSGLHSIVHISSPSDLVAKELAKYLLKEDLAVGVCITPTVSVMYKWQGEIIEDSESLMLVKTRTSKVKDLLDNVNTMSTSPDTDECSIIAIKVEDEKVPYFDWLVKSIPENTEYLNEMTIPENNTEYLNEISSQIRSGKKERIKSLRLKTMSQNQNL